MGAFLPFFFSYVSLLLVLFSVLASKMVSNWLFLWLKLSKKTLKAVCWNTCIAATCLIISAMPEHMVSFKFGVALLLYFSRLCLNFCNWALSTGIASLSVPSFHPTAGRFRSLFSMILSSSLLCVKMQSEVCQL